MAYSVSRTPDYVEIRLSGATSVDELIQIAIEVLGDGSFGIEPCLVDATELEQLEIDYAAVTELFARLDGLHPRNRGSWVAIVAVQPHVFGMARMIELRSTDHARTARAFQERGEAEAWLAANRDEP